MKDGSSFNKSHVPYLVCGLVIESDKSIEEVAGIISAKLLGGVPFVGKEEFIYDEVPAVYAERDLLGLRIVLQGFGGEEGYMLELWPRHYTPKTPPASFLGEESRVDITEYIASLLEGTEGIRIKD